MARFSMRRSLARSTPWFFLTMAVVALPAIVIIISTIEDSAGQCELKLPLLDIVTSGCRHLRVAYGVLGAIGAFGLIALLFWKSLGLSRVFEVPWFGIGDDVENAGLVESVVRAAVFVVFLWLVLGMGAIAYVGIERSMELKAAAEKERAKKEAEKKANSESKASPAPQASPKAQSAPDAGVTQGTKANSKDQAQKAQADPVASAKPEAQVKSGQPPQPAQSLAKQPAETKPPTQPRPHDVAPGADLAALTREMERINANLANIHKELAKRASTDGAHPPPGETKDLPAALSSILQQMQVSNTTLDKISTQLRKLAPGESGTKQLPAAFGSILQQMQASNTNLDKINTQLGRLTAGESGTKDLPAALSPILQQMNVSNINLKNIDTQLGKSEQHLAEFGKQLAGIDQIRQILATSQEPGPMAGCFDLPPRPETGQASTTAGTNESPIAQRYRTTAVIRVFFDINSPILSTWAQQDLLWFLREEASTETEMVAIHGSADPQGPPGNNWRLAQNRAKAIKDFVKANSALRVYDEPTFAPEGGDPKSEPYKRVTAVRMLKPCR